MELLLSQRFNFARITPTKNYCKLCDKDRYCKTNGSSFNHDVFGLSISGEYVKKRGEYDKKNTRYFYNEDGIDRSIIFDYVKSKKSLRGDYQPFYETTKDRHIKEHYGKPTSQITIYHIERQIYRNGDKIVVKSFYSEKFRYFNCKYFRKEKRISSVSFNYKTGNFLIYDSNGTTKKRTKSSFKTNSFFFLHEFCNSKTGPLYVKKNLVNKHSSLYDLYINTFNDEIFVDNLYGAFHFDYGFYSKKSDLTIGQYLFENLIKKFVETKKIKVPNEYRDLLINNYPGEKILKKNDRKLISSILDLYEIKSKVTIKLLHQHSKLSLVELSKICYIFGKNYQKYIGSLNSNLFENHLSNNKFDNPQYTSSLNASNHHKNIMKSIMDFDIKDYERENIAKVLNSLGNLKLIEYRNHNFIGLIWDHLNMLNKIQKYDPNVRFYATTVVQFHTEHTVLTKKINLINKGWVVEYFYPNTTVMDIEKPIETIIEETKEKITLYPKILTREEDYSEEGAFMHHCVASYSDNQSSMIVSIRTKDNSDRVTCEFKLQDGRLVQSRYFSNGQPPKHYESVIEEINDKTILHARYGTLSWHKREKVPVKINGIEIKKEDLRPTLPFF